MGYYEKKGGRDGAGGDERGGSKPKNEPSSLFTNQAGELLRMVIYLWLVYSSFRSYFGLNGTLLSWVLGLFFLHGVWQCFRGNKIYDYKKGCGRPLLRVLRQSPLFYDAFTNYAGKDEMTKRLSRFCLYTIGLLFPMFFFFFLFFLYLVSLPLMASATSPRMSLVVFHLSTSSLLPRLGV